MDIPKIASYGEEAVDIVVSVINRAIETLGVRLTLWELADTRDICGSKLKVPLNSLVYPLAINGEKFIANTIEKKWKLTDKFQYCLNPLGLSQNEYAHYHYFEAIFSQPSVQYPIPQATVTVFFRIEDKLLEPEETKGAPIMTFRIEGHRTDHDVRFVTLTEDWILAEIMMKTKFFKRLEKFRMF